MRMDAADLARMNKVLRHRLRNVASGIKGAVNVLREEIEGLLPSEHMEYFPLLLQKCDQLTELTTRMNDLFDDSSPDGLEQDGSQKECSAAVLLEGLIADVHSRWPETEIRLECDDNAASTSLRSRALLSKILGEVLRNAAETSKTVEISVACRRKQDSLQFVVSDSGGNAPLPDDLDAIFLPFWTTKSGHDGIGLAVAKKSASVLDGKIEISRNEEGGFTVVIEIPVPGVRKYD